MPCSRSLSAGCSKDEFPFLASEAKTAVCEAPSWHAREGRERFGRTLWGYQWLGSGGPRGQARPSKDSGRPTDTKCEGGMDGWLGRRRAARG